MVQNEGMNRTPYAVLLALVLGLGCGGGKKKANKAKSAVEAKGDLTERILDAIPSAEEGEFPTPESAIEHYVKCLKSGDITSMAKVLAIKEMVTHWDFKNHAINMGAWPSNEGNMEYRHSKLLRGLGLYRLFYDKMVWDITAKIEWGMTVNFRGQTEESDEKVDEEQEFEKIFGPTRNPDLSGLEHEITATELSNDGGSFHLKNMTEMTNLYGGDDWKTPILILKLRVGDVRAQQGFMMFMIKYGSNWKMKGYTEWR